MPIALPQIVRTRPGRHRPDTTTGHPIPAANLIYRHHNRTEKDTRAMFDQITDDTAAPILSALETAVTARDNYRDNQNRDTLHAHIRSSEALNDAIRSAGVRHVQRLDLAEMFNNGASLAELADQARTFQTAH